MEITIESRPDEGPSSTRTRRYRRRRINLLKVVHCSETLPLSDAVAEAPPPPCYTLLKDMSPLLILVPLKYQAKGDDNDLFKKIPVAVWSFVVATCVYSLMLELTKRKALESKSPIHEMLRRAAVAAGVVSAVSLVSLFLPHRVSFLPLITWFMLPVVLTWPLLKHAYNWLDIGGTVATLINKIWAFGVRARGRETTDEDASYSSRV